MTDQDSTTQLRQALVDAIVEQTGMRGVLAEPYADAVLAYLQREHGGGQLYIPAAARQYDLLQIRAQLERGVSVSRVCMEHAMSRTTLYKLFPGGIPRKAERPEIRDFTENADNAIS